MLPLSKGCNFKQISRVINTKPTAAGSFHPCVSLCQSVCHHSFRLENLPSALRLNKERVFFEISSNKHANKFETVHTVFYTAHSVILVLRLSFFCGRKYSRPF